MVLSDTLPYKFSGQGQTPIKTPAVVMPWPSMASHQHMRPSLANITFLGLIFKKKRETDKQKTVLELLKNNRGIPIHFPVSFHSINPRTSKIAFNFRFRRWRAVNRNPLTIWALKTVTVLGFVFRQARCRPNKFLIGYTYGRELNTILFEQASASKFGLRPQPMWPRS